MSRSPRRGRSVKARIYTLAGVCLVPAVVAVGLALSALGTLDARVSQIDAHAVKPLAQLGYLRDMEGDMRVLIWEYLDSAAGDRADVRQEVQDTDAEADADIAGYSAAHGSADDARAALMTTFVAKLTAWRAVRDDKIMKLVDAGDAAGARAVVQGELVDADDAMAEPLDQLFDAEVAAADALREATRQDYTRTRTLVTGLVSIGLLVAVVLALLMARGMIRPIGRIRRVMTSGDRDARVTLPQDGSDLAALGHAIDEMLDGMAQQDAELAAQQAEREGQLTSAYVRQQLAEQQVRRRAQESIDSTAKVVVGELQAVVQQAEAVHRAVATIDERIASADEVTQAVVRHAADANRVVSAVGESLKRVTGITMLIAGVAEQTNLLALNATIEAARAGDAGKGFSVVATEVKELAAQTARSTHEITATVESLEHDAAAMAAAITVMTEGVSGIDEATSKVSEVAAAQRMYADQLSRSVQEAMTRISGMTASTDTVDRRRQQRIAADGRVSLLVGGQRREGTLLDISEGGLRCELPAGQGLSQGASLQVELLLDGRTLTLSSRVARAATVDGGAVQIGIEFLNPSDATRASVLKYIQQLLGASAELV